MGSGAHQKYQINCGDIDYCRFDWLLKHTWRKHRHTADCLSLGTNELKNINNCSVCPGLTFPVTLINI